MLFVLGRQHFKIRSFDPHELGLTQKKTNDFTIEVRQNYFHVFRLPFFGLGKTWAIRKNEQLFELPEDYKMAIRERGDLLPHTPWFTYTGPLFLTLLGLCFVITAKYSSWQQHRDSRAEYAVIAEDNSRRFRHPSPDDYYILVARDGSEKYAHITGLDKQHIQLAYINDAQVKAYSAVEIAGLFIDHAGNLSSITLNRADSGRLICSEYERRSSFAGMPLNNEDGKTWRVESIIRMDGPIFRDGGYASNYNDSRHSFSMHIENEGLPATITSIEPVEGEIQWIASKLPLEAQPAQPIALEGVGNFNKRYKAKITCTDERGRQLQYLMEGRHLHNTFRKIEL